jgi:hypothetical protein
VGRLLFHTFAIFLAMGGKSMKRFLSLTLCLAMVAAASVAFAATSGTAGGDNVQRHIAVSGPGVLLTSSTSSAIAARETAGPDTFALYGGPDEAIEGKFNLANGVTPDWGDGTGSGYTGAATQWRPVDLTDQPVYWHQSTFNAENLNGNGAGNNAIWSGVETGDPIAETWSNTPGYGNSWNDAVLYEGAPLADPSAGQTVSLDFVFNHDTEPGYDYFVVQYDSAGTWTTVMARDGSNRDTLNVFQAPGETFSANQTAPIFYAGNDYGGDLGDQIRIRLVVQSDGAWSDQDGLWPTLAGAAQVDDITLTTSQGTFTEDFEGAGPYLFVGDKSPFAGDFAEVYPKLTDVDPCRDNNTPVIGMIDFGQEVRNGPSPTGETTTGGTTSAGVNYGIIGNYVVNYNGGLSFGEVSLTNEIWSPEILWDLPGTGDDDVEISGAFIRWTGWTHLPLGNGFFYVWHVRSAQPGQPFDSWTDRNFVYYGGGVPLWANYAADVSDILQQGPERVQMALGAWDYASIFGFAGTAATPSPCFDNAAFYKYRLGGPTFATRTIDTAQDGFPINGSIDVSTAASRGALDIPFSMARDVNSGDLVNTPGDSIIIDVASVIPGATVTDIRMVWALQTSDVFEDALRAAPARAKDVNVVTGPAGTVWSGEVIADTSTTSAGAIVENRFFVDLPDVDFMYPGDLLHYYIQATDSDGRTTTFPGNTNGFGNFDPNTPYNRAFVVRGLPTITDTAGAQPSILVWNDFGRRGGENEWFTAFQQLGYAEGVDYDTYTTQGPTSGVSNGLGSAGAHGANADQLAGYNHMFYFSGNLSTFLLSDGSNAGNNDKGNDVDVLEQWHALAGTRNAAYFGDYIATAMVNDSSAALGYLQTTMGVLYGDADVRDVIGGQTAPLVVPNAGGPYAANFATDYIAYGGCLSINQFDQIQPQAGAAAGHLFTDAGGAPIPENPDPAAGGVASVINPTANGLDITFPYASFFVYNTQARAVNLSARTLLFQEILGLFSAPNGGSPIVSAPKAAKAELLVRPNPFNPQTTVKFTTALGSKGSVKVFNLRGELVKTLHSGEFQTQTFTWDGTDNRGASVASGVYVIQAQAGGTVLTKKAALVK